MARAAIVDVCEVLGIELSDQQRASLDAMDIAALEALRAQIKRERRWPA